MSGPEKPTSQDRAEHACITPEGYDVLTVEGAEAYLVEVHGLKLPEPGGYIDESTGYHLALRLQQEQRAALYYAEDIEANGGELPTQNVAEHSVKVGMTAVWKAMAERPELDAGKVAIMSLFHDVIEAYCKDTVVNDPVGLKSKYFRETAGMTLVKRDLGKDHPLIAVLEEYEGKSAEAKFVKGRDKVEAYQFSLNNKAVLHRQRQEHFPKVVEQALIRASIDRTAYKDMQAVMKELGRKWHVWGCMPFEGNPDEIVEFMARKVSAEQMKGSAPYMGGIATRVETEASNDSYDLEVTQYNGSSPTASNVTSLLEWRRQKQATYHPPTTPVA